MKVTRILSILLLTAFLVSAFGPVASVRASEASQTDTPATMAKDLLNAMTPEERVGQLFLVSFTGSTAEEGSTIYDLVTRQHIGGVMLLSSNDNFVDAPQTTQAAYDLIAALQTANWNFTQTPVTNLSDGKQINYNYVPLFVGISQDGDGSPNDQILSGLTPLPDLMSLGATWQPTLANETGAVAGRELSTLGFNLYFGPSLDVLELPGTSAGSGLGASVFGGDPYWVGKMGQSYISGLHQGSDGRLAVIAKHFPGRGSADRPSGDEVATVRKSLEQLKQIELAPFFTVTGGSHNSTSMADGLLVSHIRYQGFQGNIRATTRPVSFDSQALTQILSLPDFTTWRNDGGLMVSDDLGSTTIRRFYDPGGTSFSARLVVRDAFLAGNDLLYLGNIVSSDQPDNYNTVVQVLQFFAQKYREDTAFAQRVDAAVLRILTLKYRLYNDFDLNTVIPPQSNLDTLGTSQSVTFDVARQSATLISPDAADIASVLPQPPNTRDYILFLTETPTQRQCSACIEQQSMSVDALQSAVLTLYGPQAGNLVNPERVSSFSFDDLAAILQGGTGNDTLVYELNRASWVVISMLDSDPSQPQVTLRRFLSERQDLLRNKNIILFSFNLPYTLDSTDISKLTAYYGLYSKSAPFVEIAARILFQELTPSGTLPVSVPGIGYDLLSATAPDPNQVIFLSLDLPAAPVSTASTTPEPVPTPNFRVGDTITIDTGIIIDHNGHPVPDVTGVHFTLTMSGSNDIIQQVDASTVDGVAKASFSIDRSGLLEVRATSDPATTSYVLQLNATSEGVSVAALPPTSVTTEIVPTPTAVAVITPEPTDFPSTTGRPGMSGWLLMLVLLGGLGFLAFWLGGRFFSMQWGMRWALCAVLGGLGAYNYLAFGLPGGANWLMKSGFFGMVGVVFAGMLVGLAAGWLWQRLSAAKMRSG
jgi:beta-N-acetylhexosaminidase